MLNLPEPGYNPLHLPINAELVHALVNHKINPGIVFVLGLEEDPEQIFTYDNTGDETSANPFPDVLISQACDPLLEFAEDRLTDWQRLQATPGSLQFQKEINFYRSKDPEGHRAQSHARFLITGLLRSYRRAKRDFRPRVRNIDNLDDNLQSRIDYWTDQGTNPTRLIAAQMALDLYAERFLD